MDQLVVFQPMAFFTYSRLARGFESALVCIVIAFGICAATCFRVRLVLTGAAGEVVPGMACSFRFASDENSHFLALLRERFLRLRKFGS